MQRTRGNFRTVTLRESHPRARPAGMCRPRPEWASKSLAASGVSVLLLTIKRAAAAGSVVCAGQATPAAFRAVTRKCWIATLSAIAESSSSGNSQVAAGSYASG